MKVLINEDGTFSILDISLDDLESISDCLFIGDHEGFSTDATEKLREEIEILTRFNYEKEDE